MFVFFKENPFNQKSCQKCTFLHSRKKCVRTITMAEWCKRTSSCYMCTPYVWAASVAGWWLWLNILFIDLFAVQNFTCASKEREKIYLIDLLVFVINPSDDALHIHIYYIRNEPFARIYIRVDGEWVRVTVNAEQKRAKEFGNEWKYYPSNGS